MSRSTMRKTFRSIIWLGLSKQLTSSKLMLLIYCKSFRTYDSSAAIKYSTKNRDNISLLRSFLFIGWFRAMIFRYDLKASSYELKVYRCGSLRTEGLSFLLGRLWANWVTSGMLALLWGSNLLWRYLLPVERLRFILNLVDCMEMINILDCSFWRVIFLWICASSSLSIRRRIKDF
jgi:hypothetical protein